MAKKQPVKSYCVGRHYTVFVTKVISADNIEAAAARLASMKYEDFDTVENTDRTDGETIITET